MPGTWFAAGAARCDQQHDEGLKGLPAVSSEGGRGIVLRLVGVIMGALLLTAGCGPSRYLPPQSVVPSNAGASWTVTTTRQLCAVCGQSPLSLEMIMPQENWTTGAAVTFRLDVDLNPYARAALFHLPTPLKMAIAQARGKVVWEKTLPVLPPLSPASQPQTVTWTMLFTWDQVDADGHRVPPGRYKAYVPLPVTVAYSFRGVARRETITASSDALNGGRLASAPFNVVPPTASASGRQ